MGETIRLDAEPRSVSRARRFCATTLRAWGAAEDVLDTCTLLVSELATNAVLHARTSFTVTVAVSSPSTSIVRVEVRDADTRTPRIRDYGPEASSGRGMHLVADLSSRSGCDVDGTGKSVWFEVPWTSEVVT